jgi:phosphate transport system protein
MKHNEQEMEFLKKELYQMWKMVISQLEKVKHSFLKNDINIATEVIAVEKSVNAFELKMDKSCEGYIALYSPVAIDLRLILSIMKISVTLERIGDYANGIARHVKQGECSHFNDAVVEMLDIETMFDALLSMMTDSFVAFNSESSSNTQKILAKDKEVNKIYRESIIKLTEYAKANPEDMHCVLMIVLLIRNMERIGDHCKNIVEEIVFYLEAKVLKHEGKTD